MIFQHMLLDEVLCTLTDENPMKLDCVKTKDAYHHEASMIFSYVYMYTPPPNSQVPERAVADLALGIRIVFETVHHATLTPDVVIQLARTLIENARQMERKFVETARVITGLDRPDIEQAVEDMLADMTEDESTGEGASDVDELPSLVDEKDWKRWKLN
jgi:hypothetical protein